jgi:plastocyanin
MRKPIVAVLAVSALAGIPAAPAVASGGGGCGSPTTEGTGSDVSITGFCFEPTVLYTEPGTTVTFSNMDPVRHNVLGAQGQWGSWETVREGASVTNAFAEPGVYPYVCTWHAGMAGAVVVLVLGHLTRFVLTGLLARFERRGRRRPAEEQQASGA